MNTSTAMNMPTAEKTKTINALYDSKEIEGNLHLQIKGAGTKSCKSPHRSFGNRQQCYQYTITGGSIMVSTRASASSGYGRSKVRRSNIGCKLISCKCYATRGSPQACGLWRNSYKMSKNPIWVVFLSPHEKIDAFLIGIRTRVDYERALDKLKATASQSATWWASFERVIVICFLRNDSETSCESGFEYTDNLRERLHTYIECAQSAGSAAVYSSTHCPNLDNPPPIADTVHSDITLTDSGIDIEDDSESSGTTEPVVSIKTYELLLDNSVTFQGDTTSLESSKEISDVHEPNWDSLPGDIQGYVLCNLKYEDLVRVKLVSRGIRKLIESPVFLSSRGDTVRTEGLLTSLYFYVKDGALQWSGYDLILKEWRSLPTLGCLPSPDIDLFKDYLVSSAGGLLCANVSKSLHKEELVVCNPMTQTRTVLPPLNFPRNPVLMHMLVNPATKSYKVIVAGSSGMTHGHILSRKTEVFDSCTCQWEVEDDLPGSEFSLNEFQTGVCINGILYCIAFMEDGSGKGVLAYDVEKGKWLSDWKCPLPCAGNATSFSITQLVECDGEVYLFSERESSRTVEHGIDKLVHSSGGIWKNVVREERTGGRGLLLYPEYACVGFGAGKLCVFNTIEHTGKVYDICNDGLVERLPSIVKSKGGEMFHSLNPLSFTFEPNFTSTV